MSDRAHDRFAGGLVGGRAILASGVIGIAGLVAAGIGIGLEPARGLFAYLFAFAYWIGLVVGAQILLLIWHTAQSRWPIVLRRILEAFCSTLPLFPFLFVPILAGSSLLFPWRAPDQLAGKTKSFVEHQAPYLNMAFWCVRAAVYFAVWITVSELLFSWSKRQDEEGGLQWLSKQRRLGTAALPVVAWLFSMASLDWLMVLDPRWTSTIFGLYYLTGSFVSAIAVLTIATIVARRGAPFDSLVNPNHLASLGKMMLAFVAFWAYIAFDQYMLVWIADIPGENDWFIVRTSGTWRGIAIAVVVGQFVVPFFALLSRDLKLHRPWALLGISIWILLAHALDVYWIVLPGFDRLGIDVHWEDPLAFLGIGGVIIAFAGLRLRATSIFPNRDPYLADSLRYSGD